MKRPEWTIRTSDILDGDEGEDVDFTLTEEEREDIRRDVERITDKRAALLSKENGKEYADYTLTRDRMGRVEVQDFSVSLGDGWNWREEMDNEILRRANALSGDTQSFSALAGIDTALRQAARKIEVRLPTLDEAHKATALRARMEGNTDGRFTLRILDDAALWEDCTREAAARVGVLFPVPEGGEGPEVFLSEEDAALLEDAIGAYVLACGLARFYGSRSLDAGQKEEAARAADLENVLRSFARNQAGGSYARLKERWKEEAVAQAVAVLSPFSARLGQDGTLSLSLRLESGDAAQACALVRTAILAKVMERFYSALLRGEEAGTYATKAQAALEAATAVFRRQRTYPDGGFFDSLLTVATGDADLLFARLKSRKTRPMYRSAVTLRVLSLFYAQLGLPDLAAAYEGDMRARAELARSLAAEFSAAYTVVQGRLADGLRQLPDLLAPLQRALPLPPVEDGGDEAVLRLMQQRARLSYSCAYGIKGLAESFLVYFALSGWLELCGDKAAAERGKYEEVSEALRRAVAWRTDDAGLLLQKMEDAARDLHALLFPYYDAGQEEGGFLFDEQRLRLTYALSPPYSRQKALEDTLAACLEHAVLADWYVRLGDPLAEGEAAIARSCRLDALALACKARPRPYDPIP